MNDDKERTKRFMTFILNLKNSDNVEDKLTEPERYLIYKVI